MRWVTGAGLLWLCVLCMGPSCGMDDGEQGEGAPCTRTPDCTSGLDCIAGACTRPADGGPGDGAVEGGMPDGG